MEVQKPIKLVIVRHGHSVHNGTKKELFQNEWSSKLTDLGAEQSRRVAYFLRQQYGNESIMLLSSKTLRASQTTKIITSFLFENGVQVVGMNYSDLICERKISDKLHGKPIPADYTERQIDDFVIKNNFGEAMENVWLRAPKFAKQLKADPYQHGADTLVVVSHYFAITAFVGTCLGLQRDDAVKTLKFDNGGVTLGAVSLGKIEIYPDKINFTDHLNSDAFHIQVPGRDFQINPAGK